MCECRAEKIDEAKSRENREALESANNAELGEGENLQKDCDDHPACVPPEAVGVEEAVMGDGAIAAAGGERFFAGGKPGALGGGARLERRGGIEDQ